jgi:ketosteroid isomerase-like protein
MEQFSTESTEASRAKFGGQQDEETQVIAVMKGVHEAFRAKDLEKIMSFYADDIVAYDMMPPLAFKGKNEYRKAWQMGIEGMTDVGELETAEKKVLIGGNLAVVHCLCHMTGTMKKDNQKMDMWSRYTGVLQKNGAGWKIVHEQFSVPIEMESEKAMWTLKPEGKEVVH